MKERYIYSWFSCIVAKRRVLFWSLLFLVLGCETEFEPFAESSEVFSVIGYLDTERDTQFVRIEVLQDGIFLGGPDQPLGDVDVTLEHVPTGQRYAMQDSLFQFSGATVHNFWASVTPKVGEPYALIVRQQDGAESVTQVTMPDAFPVPVFGAPPLCLGRGCDATPIPLTITGVERLVAVVVTYAYRRSGEASCVRLPVSYTEATMRVAGGYRVVISWLNDMRTQGVEQFEALEVLVVSGDAAWPDVTTLDEETLFLPQTVSNIDKGVGFFGGVTRRTVSVFDNKVCR